MAAKERRREVRLTAADDDLIAEAAGLSGVSVSEFVTSRALSDAEAIVRAHRTIELDRASYHRFLDMLDTYAGPPRELMDQVSKARSLKHGN
jgi:uncharacterized protein (DUF1778 family)